MSGRRDVSDMILELRQAVRRPLFTEIALDETMYATGPSENETTNSSPVPPVVPSDQQLKDAASEADSQRILSSPLFRQQEAKRPPRTWKMLLKDASELLHLMTEREHGEVSKLAAILLLGFILPHSTGNEYFLTQHVPVDGSTTENDLEDTDGGKSNIDYVLDYVLHMDLEERIESTCRHYSANEFGEFAALTDATWELAMDSFVREGLAPFLGGRPAHLEQADLIHLLAMIIHPQPSESFIPESAKSFEDLYYWQRARRFMKNLHAHSFHVNYGHRLRMVKLVAQDLVIPSYDPDLPMVNCPLFDGALPHLRASLHAFSRSAMSMDDGHWSRCALVAIAIQSRRDIVLKEEWEYLLNRMVDDRTQYPGCKSCPQQLRRRRFGFFKKQIDRVEDDLTFCPHAARGIYLTEFLICTCQSRHFAGKDFLEVAFSSLTDAIEWQMHCWRQPPNLKPKNSEEPTCLLTSLLFAAKTIFYFLLPLEERKSKTNGDHDDNLSDAVARRDDLIHCAIQLVHHWDLTIAGEASELLALAFAYGTKKSIEAYARPLFLSLKKLVAIDLSNKLDLWTKDAFGEAQLSSSRVPKVVSVTSRLSPNFAISFLSFLLTKLEGTQNGNDESVGAGTEDPNGGISMGETDEKEKEKDDTTADNEKQKAKFALLSRRFVLKLVGSIALANPMVAAEKLGDFKLLLGKLTDHISRFNLIAAILACRQSHFFVESKGKPTDSTAVKAMTQTTDRWRLYQMARHALRTGNFGTASACYNEILKTPLSEQHFLWIAALTKVSDAEMHLSQTAACGIPSATTALRSAYSIFQSLHELSQSESSNFTFQKTFVALRLDLMDLLTALRQLIREMRLTGVGPARRTRSFLHFQNIVKSFDALALRYRSMYQKYGLFVCQQSRTSLRTLYALCRFIARSVRIVFTDLNPSFSVKKEDSWPGAGCSGDTTMPMARFMQRLDESLLRDMNTSIDLVIRAAAMLEVVDGILLCPVPMPLSFFGVTTVPSAVLRLSGNPDLVDIVGKESAFPRDSVNWIECYTGVSFRLYAAGEISDGFIDKSQLPFSVLLLRHRARYDGPLQGQDDENLGDEKQEDELPALTTTGRVIPSPWNFTSVATRMFPNGKFLFTIECPPIREEGNYLVEVQLGCRDIRGGEWDISVDKACTAIQVAASRPS